jgi:hypothetical protein
VRKISLTGTAEALQICSVKEVITTHMRKKLAGMVRQIAVEEEMSISRCVEWLVERALDEKNRIPVITRSDIERDIREVNEHPERCITYDSAEDYLKDFDARTSAID